MPDTTHTLVRKRLYSAASPHGAVTAWAGSGRSRLLPEVAVLVSWLEIWRAADTVGMRRLSSGTPRGWQTLGKHRVVTPSGPHVDAIRLPVSDGKPTRSCEIMRVWAARVPRVCSLSRTCTCLNAASAAAPRC